MKSENRAYQGMNIALTFVPDPEYKWDEKGYDAYVKTSISKELKLKAEKLLIEWLEHGECSEPGFQGESTISLLISEIKQKAKNNNIPLDILNEVIDDMQKREMVTIKGNKYVFNSDSF